MPQIQITLTLNTPANVPAAQVRDELCSYFGYSGGDTNAEKLAFLRTKGQKYFIDAYKASKRVNAGRVAEISAETTAGSEVTGG
jgi:hypothetical protein